MGFNNEDEYISPLIFLGDDEERTISPISSLKKDINGITRFAISKLTANGKYIRNNLLYYSFNGVDIYTDINNIIFVNTDTKSLFIRENDKIEAEINPKDPEEKQYIILYTDLGWDDAANEDEFPLRWVAVTGRTAAYDSIKNNAPIIDIDKSIIIAETVALKDAVSVRDFMNYIKNAEIIVDESFDINDYTGGEYI